MSSDETPVKVAQEESSTPSPAINIAVVGCGHGELNSIYEDIEKCKQKVDLLIICGDLQTLRNNCDMRNLCVPDKYKRLGDFHEYYSGQRMASVLTIFIGGNHEAYSYLWELYYGGWVAHNMYFLGWSNVVKFGSIRIAAINGIFKLNDYTLPYKEKSPYSSSDIRSIYHMRKREVFKLSLVKEPITVFISHDWPRHIAFFGNIEELVRRKEHFINDIRSGLLGAPPLQHLLHLHSPRYWFAAHLHVKFSALVPSLASFPLFCVSRDKVDLDFNTFSHLPNFAKASSLRKVKERDTDFRCSEWQPVVSQEDCREVYKDSSDDQKGPVSVTRFLALDKVLPRRHYMQMLQLDGETVGSLEYDREWLAIVRATALEIPLESSVSDSQLTPLEAWDGRLEEARAWVDENIVDCAVPINFAQTAPEARSHLLHGNAANENSVLSERVQYNLQTVEYCKLLGIPNEVCEKGVKIEEYKS